MTTEGFADDGTTLKELAQFDLAQEMKESEQKRPWPMGHFAKMLFKKSDFRMVLIMMDSGSVLKEHHADGTISIQVLKGSVDFRAQGETRSVVGGAQGGGYREAEQGLCQALVWVEEGWERRERFGRHDV